MANITQAAEWLKEGKKVRTPDMPKGEYLEYDADEDDLYWVPSYNLVIFLIHDFLREDWECL